MPKCCNIGKSKNSCMIFGEFPDVTVLSCMCLHFCQLKLGLLKSVDFLNYFIYCDAWGAHLMLCLILVLICLAVDVESKRANLR